MDVLWFMDDETLFTFCWYSSVVMHFSVYIFLGYLWVKTPR
jgi:hypothetical protein